jgi:hypothetical protein
MKIRVVGAELIHAEGRTDRHNELIIGLRNFANAPKPDSKIEREQC